MIITRAHDSEERISIDIKKDCVKQTWTWSSHRKVKWLRNSSINLKKNKAFEKQKTEAQQGQCLSDYESREPLKSCQTWDLVGRHWWCLHQPPLDFENTIKIFSERVFFINFDQGVGLKELLQLKLAAGVGDVIIVKQSDFEGRRQLHLSKSCVDHVLVGSSN